MNEITTIQDRKIPTVFDDYETFEHAYQMAQALSKTQLIPENFQGKPEDCLIALDYSRRMGLPPTAVLPHLYVIGGRPSTSAQFMISLVNKSGVFSRIQWKESCDGEVEYFANNSKRTIKNYGAVAYFKELATGTEYSSPLIDVKFALANGWLTKNDSKWQKMPEVMCRYRSASILIKTVCPELAMGMEFAEDVQDSIEETPRIPQKNSVVVETIVPQQIKEQDSEIVAELEPTEDDSEERFEKLLENLRTATADDLADIGKSIADAGLPEEKLEELRAEFKKRRDDLTSRKRKVDSLVKKLNGKLKKASTFEELDAVKSEIDSATLAGELGGTGFDSVMGAYQSRVNDFLAEREKENARTFEERLSALPGTEEQHTWAYGLLQAILDANNAKIVEANLDNSEEWLRKGYMTSEMYSLVQQIGTETLEKFKR